MTDNASGEDFRAAIENGLVRIVVVTTGPGGTPQPVLSMKEADYCDSISLTQGGFVSARFNDTYGGGNEFYISIYTDAADEFNFENIQ